MLLTKEASIDAKKFFKAKLSYNCDRILLDLKGPSFEVLLSACKVTDLASCGKSDDELVAYYKKEFGADYADQTLTAVEFEPTYWFGEYEIPGLKPLYSDYSWESFDAWIKDRNYKSARYYFELNGHVLNLNNKVEKPEPVYLTHDQHIPQANLEATRARTCFTFGIDDTNTWGAQCTIGKKVPKSSAPLTLYDGLSNKQVVLNESDLLIESFIRTTSTTKGKGIKPFFQGHVNYYAMLCVDNKFQWFSGSRAEEFKKFDWSKEQSNSIYVGVTADEDLREDYAKFGIDIESLKMLLGLSIEEKDSLLFNNEQKGPSYQGSLHHMYDLEFDNVWDRSRYKYDNIKVKPVKLAAKVSQHVDIVNAAKLYLEWILKSPDRRLYSTINPNKPKTGLIRKIYAIKFDLDYTSPTGKKVKGLKPFGPIFDKKEDKIYESELKISSLTQEGVPPESTISPLTIKLPESASYLNDDLPWTTVQSDQSRSKSSASVYWDSIKGDQKMKKKWLQKWVKEGAELLTAPEPKGQIS